MRIGKPYMIGGFLCLLLVCMMSVVGVFWLVTNEKIDSTKGTLKWRLTIRSSVIRNFPIIESSGEPCFIAWALSGAQPEADVIEYESNAPIDHLLTKLDEYLHQAGCVAAKSDELSGFHRSYLHKGKRVELELSQYHSSHSTQVRCIYLH